MSFNLKDITSKAEKDYGLNSGDNDWFKFVEGVNRLRILSTPSPYASHFKKGACLGKETCPDCIANSSEPDEKKHNKPSVKFLCHVLDYTDNKIKLAQLPYSIMKSLEVYQNDPDYSFDVIPMPYDIKVTATDAGTKEVEYQVIPSPKREPVSTEVTDKLSKTNTAEQIKDAMISKRKKTLGLEVSAKDDKVPYPTENIRPEDIPF